MALQATLRVFGLCGSRVVLVWVVLWFLDRLWFLALVCASDRAHVVFVGRWSCPRCSMLDARCSMPTIARPLALCGSVVLPSMLDARCRRLRVLLLFVD